MPGAPIDQEAGDITGGLAAWRQGDAQAFNRLLQRIRGDLRRMAAARLRGHETPSLASDDLIQEALLRVVTHEVDWKDRAHFFGTLAVAMRQVLVDHARARQALKRGGGADDGGAWQRITWSVSQHGEEALIVDLLNFDQLFRQFQSLDPRAARIVELAYFAGLERADIADLLDLSLATVERDLRFARSWLGAQLAREIPT